MASRYVRIKVSINDDPDFLALSYQAQWFYERVLLTHADPSPAGVMDWRPRKLLNVAGNVTLPLLLAAAAELEHARFALFDRDTEEVLARTYVRHDEPMRNPKMAAAVIKAYRTIGSMQLRAAVVTEIVRDHKENPKYSSWTHKDTADSLALIMSRPTLAEVGYTYAYPVDNADPIGDPDPIGNGYASSIRNGYADPVGNTEVDPDQEHQSISVDFLPLSPASLHPSTRNPDGGHLTGVPHLARDPSDEPPSNDSLIEEPEPATAGVCPRHPDGNPTNEDCRGCRDARHERTLAERDHAIAARQRRLDDIAVIAEANRRAIDACPLGCAHSPEPGYLDGRVCDHDPEAAERNATGLARARIAACRRCNDDGERADGSECDHRAPSIVTAGKSKPSSTPIEEGPTTP